MRKQGKYIIDKRLKFKKGLQKKFIKKIKKESKTSWPRLAEKLDISEHTIKWDLYKEKTTMPLSLAQKMLKMYPIENIGRIKKDWVEKILEKNWGQKKASGSNIKKIKIPKKNEKFAEFLGIMLGDGHLNKVGIRITGNSFEKCHYEYISQVIEETFGLKSRIYKSYTAPNTIILNVYSKQLVDTLKNNGLVIGNKIKNKASLPPWIFEDKNFIFGALRGLLDTDGGIYFKQKKYKRALIEFQTNSPTIRKDIKKLLTKGGFSLSKSSTNIRIQNQEEIHKFFKLVGSSNPKNIIRYKEIITKKHISLKEELTTKILNYKEQVPFKMQP